MAGFFAGALVQVSQKDGEYNVKQIDEENPLPPAVPGRSGSRKEISWSFGPVKIVGYIDLDTYEIGITLSVLGISLGSFYGNLKEGLGINIDLLLAKGSVKLYLKNGNELWVRIDIDVKFDGSYHEDFKILSW